MIKYLLEMFLISLTLTIAVELAAIWLFSRISSSMSFIHEKQGVLLVVLVNVLTNPPAVLICWLAGLYMANTAMIAVQLLTEMIVVAAEAWIYYRFAKDKQWKLCNPVILSCVANLCSWLCGIALMAVRNIII